MSRLEVVWTDRAGGSGRTQRRYLDFVIDGVPLSSRLSVDFISPFGWLTPRDHEAAIDRLLGNSPPDMPNGRNTLYICPECADIGCGAVTLIVESGPDHIIWKDFGFENNYENVVHTAGFEDIGPFTFDVRQYRELFGRILQMTT